MIAKGDRDYATRVDLQIETQVKAALADVAAAIPFLGEETGGSLEPTRMWVLGPIDGTTNFIKGSPLCAISLALLEGGQPVIGIVDLPLLDERYVARATATGRTRSISPSCGRSHRARSACARTVPPPLTSHGSRADV